MLLRFSDATRRRLGRLDGNDLAIAAVVLIGLASLLAVSITFDARVAAWALTNPPAVVSHAKTVSLFGLSGYMYALAGLTVVGALVARGRIVDRRHEQVLTIVAERAFYILAILSASGIPVHIVKHLVGRARPRYYAQFGAYHVEGPSMANSLASFPSGHSATVFAMAVALGFMLPRLRLPLLLLATGIAVSRILALQHFVSDVLAGATLGILTALWTTWLFAGWRLAFTLENGRPRLKAPGIVTLSLRRGSTP